MAFEHPKGKGWYGDFRINGRRMRKLFSNKAKAELWEAQLFQARENEGLGIEKVRKVRFKDFSKIYLAEYSPESKPSHKTEFYTMKSLDAFFGEMYLSDIHETTINRYCMIKLKDNLAGATLNRHLALLQVLFNRAKKHQIDNQKIFKGDNPVIDVERYDEIERVRYLTIDEINKLYSFCKGPLLSLVKLAIHTGMRKGELMRLVWGDIDFNAQVIRIQKSKSGRPRTIPMALGAREAIMSLPKKEEKLFEMTHRKAFETALENAEITNFRFHDLRHTFASHFIMQGGSQSSLMEILGHSNREMTDRYVTLSSEYHTRQISRMDNIWTPEENCENSKTPQAYTTA